eukprot:scaffold172435_cov37-Tisochrysis_lutea.AAC.2
MLASEGSGCRFRIRSSSLPEEQGRGTLVAGSEDERCWSSAIRSFGVVDREIERAAYLLPAGSRLERWPRTARAGNEHSVPPANVGAAPLTGSAYTRRWPEYQPASLQERGAPAESCRWASSYTSSSLEVAGPRSSGSTCARVTTLAWRLRYILRQTANLTSVRIFWKASQNGRVRSTLPLTTSVHTDERIKGSKLG